MNVRNKCPILNQHLPQSSLKAWHQTKRPYFRHHSPDCQKVKSLKDTADELKVKMCLRVMDLLSGLNVILMRTVHITALT